MIFSMLTPDQIQHIIDYVILIDTYDEYEMSTAWYEIMNDSQDFPFVATAHLPKKGGDQQPRHTTVVSLQSDSEAFRAMTLTSHTPRHGLVPWRGSPINNTRLTTFSQDIRPSRGVFLVTLVR